MDKNERFERYKYLTGLSSWEISSYKDKDLIIFVNDGPCGLRKPVYQEFTNQSEVYTSVCMPAPSAAILNLYLFVAIPDFVPPAV